MRADNSRHLIAAAQQRAEQRAEQTRRKALAAVRRLDNTGRPISFDNVAREARVSRSWLYTQADVRSELERLRGRHQSTAKPGPPERQRASEASVLRRLQATATERVRQLERANHELRDALAPSASNGPPLSQDQPVATHPRNQARNSSAHADMHPRIPHRQHRPKRRHAGHSHDHRAHSR